jgi:hypothetical protein
VATQLGLDVPLTVPNARDVYQANLKSIFNATVTSGGSAETIRNLSLLDTSTRPVASVLKAGKSESQFVVWDPLNAALTSTDITAYLGTAFPTAPIAVSVLGTPSGALASGDYSTTPQSDGTKHGIVALDGTDIFNILCIPPDQRLAGEISWADTLPSVFNDALKYCVDRRAMLLIDPPVTSANTPVPAFSLAKNGIDVLNAFATVGINGNNARNAAMYFPRVQEVDPLNGNRVGTFASCGVVAGVMAATDASRGVWKAPAGIDAGISGTVGLAVNMTDAENGEINPIGINALRTFPIVGSVLWGARTMRGSDQVADDYKYVPVRRFALFLEESLFRGLKFAVFEPNDEPLWSQIRLNVGAFLNNLFRQGAFQGRTPRDAYFVKCDNETTTQNDINLGVVNVLVGFAPLKPAEFVVIKIQQIAGQVTT